jgi:peptidoglycan-N-acetylglucosamine deacetylase
MAASALVRPHVLLRRLYPGAIWRMPKTSKTIYLTFDDGPVPGVTDEVLRILAKFDIRATFFCVGDNVRKHPSLFHALIQAGHAVGNHTFHHVDGWRTAGFTYMRELAKCAELVSSPLFRPPYGRMRRSQYKAIQRNYRVIMWDVLSRDFDLAIGQEQCLQNTIHHSRPGSVVVFHDSEKAASRMLYALPLYIEHMLAEGYMFSLFPA